MGRPYMMSHGDILWIGRMRVPMGAAADICDANRTDRGLTHTLGGERGNGFERPAACRWFAVCA